MPITFDTQDQSIADSYPKAVAKCAFRHDSIREQIALVKIRSGVIEVDGNLDLDIIKARSAVL